MDIQPQTVKPISDDQELAKVLAGVSNINDDNFDFEETPVPATKTADDKPKEEPVADPAPEPEPKEEEKPKEEPKPDPKPEPVVEVKPPVPALSGADAGDLEGIKKDALIELRPLLDKLDITPEEKFDIYLLLLRSTDDKTIIAPAHETAQKIADESRRAQALLDIIKEIDYLSTPQQTD